MSRTFKDVMATDAESVFLNVNEFAETIRHYKAGNPNSHEDIAAIVDRDQMLKPPEGAGGRILEALDGEHGSELKTFAKLELAATVDVTFMGESLTPSLFRLADDSQWKAIAPDGADPGMQTVWCVRIDRRATRKAM